ncbi:Ctr copper transporter [Macleaya cordata]|uniref:Copper transport protein n=1 Tax=Macleaya cordata TaxID=56857 RepID=A0A200R4X2_MACCD|nr:Ctr copper transporter [Macleaya cordata]
MDSMSSMSMQMTFYWGKASEILFKGWPGTQTGMYILALIVVFALAMLVEWLSYLEFIKYGWHRVTVGLVQTFKHGIRVGLLYLVMLAVMTFNVGVFIAAVAGHTVGFLFFGSRVFS